MNNDFFKCIFYLVILYINPTPHLKVNFSLSSLSLTIILIMPILGRGIFSLLFSRLRVKRELMLQIGWGLGKVCMQVYTQQQLSGANLIGPEHPITALMQDQNK